VHTLFADGREGVPRARSPRCRVKQSCTVVDNLSQTLSDKFAWMPVQDRCITFGGVPYNPDDQYRIGPYGELYVKVASTEAGGCR
jgi:hypothetical protein